MAPAEGDGAPLVEVTGETTQVAARRLVQDEGCADLSLLNYASARNPGGGFINGAKAQEEDVARCSGLYPCVVTQLDAYYAINRAQRSLLYTHHLIYSPGVPFFRTRSRDLLAKAFEAAVITAPPPTRAWCSAISPTAPRKSSPPSAVGPATSWPRPATSAIAPCSWAPGAAGSLAMTRPWWPTPSARGSSPRPLPVPSTGWSSPCSTAPRARPPWGRSGRGSRTKAPPDAASRPAPARARTPRPGRPCAPGACAPGSAGPAPRHRPGC